MAIGPVQMIVLGFDSPNFTGEIMEELERLRESDTVRVVDSLAVYKDAEGDIEVAHMSNMPETEVAQAGSLVSALIGLAIEGETDMEGSEDETGEDPEGAWDVLEDIPNDSAAAILLLEHHWAVPLRDAVMRANGYRLGDAFISPMDLVEIGMYSEAEAKRLHDMEKTGA